MSGPGPHIDETELVPAGQAAAAPRAAVPAVVPPKTRINRAADDLVAAVRHEVSIGRAGAPLIKALEDFDKAVKEAR